MALAVSQPPPLVVTVSTPIGLLSVRGTKSHVYAIDFGADPEQPTADSRSSSSSSSSRIVSAEDLTLDAAADAAAADAAAADAAAADESRHDTSKSAPDTAAAPREDSAVYQCALQLIEYFDGKRSSFDVPLAFSHKATPFQRRTWDYMQRNVLFGDVISYGGLANCISDKGACRAVGMANNRNPLPIVVPCHRVVGSDGSLVGFAGGLWRKEWLLAHESKLRVIKQRLQQQQQQSESQSQSQSVGSHVSDSTPSSSSSSSSSSSTSTSTTSANAALRTNVLKRIKKLEEIVPPCSAKQEVETDTPAPSQPVLGRPSRRSTEHSQPAASTTATSVSTTKAERRSSKTAAVRSKYFKV